jgi:eukaryotic-like serine/threonine-protein kinase
VNTTLPQSGEVFDFRYRIVCRLGCGSDGYVFGATEIDTGKRVAIKCWIGPHSEDALAASQELIRTAHKVRLFDNPNIAEVHAAEQGRTVNYCVMDWLEGMTLNRRIARRRPSPLSDVFNIVVPCMRAVGEAHAAGILHGDIRPSHIFVCHATKHRQAIARVFDFGRGLAGLPNIPNVMRAPNAEAYQYATPELVLGAPLDARSDIYAFGVMLFEMLAGERPFVAESSDELAQKITAGSSKLLAVISPSIPSRLANVIERAMSVDPAHRFAKMSELLDALAAFDPKGSTAFVSLPRPAAVKSTALAVRARQAVTERLHVLPARRVGMGVRHEPEVEDITTTSASWELTEPVPLGRASYKLFGRIPWQHAAVWCVVIAGAAIVAQQLAAPEPPENIAEPAAASGGAISVPARAYDPVACKNSFGLLDPACLPPAEPPPAYVVPPVVPMPMTSRVGNADAPNAPIKTEPVQPQQIPQPPRRAARAADASAKPAGPKKRSEPASKQGAKRSRNKDAHSTDPFERLNNMRLQ